MKGGVRGQLSGTVTVSQLYKNGRVVRVVGEIDHENNNSLCGHFKYTNTGYNNSQTRPCSFVGPTWTARHVVHGRFFLGSSIGGSDNEHCCDKEK